MSMNAFQRALWAFWRGISVDGETYPAWLQGQVPDDAQFPYITFDVAKAAAFGISPLSATFWTKAEAGESNNALRAAFFNAASLAVPECGVRLEWDGGFCLIHRSSGDFLSVMTDEEDESVTGGRVGIEVTFYDM